MNDKKFGVMGGDAVTGESLAVFSGVVPQNEASDMMSCGMVVQRKALDDVGDAFCEVHPLRRIVMLGESLGRYLARDIPAWYEAADGARYGYVRVGGARIDFEALSVSQSVLAPGLVYQAVVQSCHGGVGF